MVDFEILIGEDTLNIVRNTLKIRVDNNSFLSEFKASHSNYPFLVIKDAISEKVFKSNLLQSRGKRKVVSCKVKEGTIIYPGKLYIIDVFQKTIKCDLVYSSEVYDLLSNDIATFMPIISVDGSPNPGPFQEESFLDIDDSAWGPFGLANKYNSYPSSDFCLPTISYPDIFGEDLEETDDWFYYWVGTQNLNHFEPSTGEMVLNVFADGDFDSDPQTPDTRLFFNRNVCAPCVFLLSPIKNALASIGWVLQGDFPDSAFAKAIFHLSENTQLTKITTSDATDEYDITDYPVLANDPAPEFDKTFINQSRKIIIPITLPGVYVVNVDLVTEQSSILKQAGVILYYPSQSSAISAVHNNGTQFTASLEFTVLEGEEGSNVTIRYLTNIEFEPAAIEGTISIVNQGYSNNIYKFNNSLDLSRFVPDEKFADYLNIIKNWFNLKITPDEVRKTLSLDYNKDFLTSSSGINFIENLKQRSFTPYSKSAYIITYEGDNPESVEVGSSSILSDTDKNSSQIQTLSLKVKRIPYNGITSQVTKELMDGDGYLFGLFNATSGLFPFTTDTINNSSLYLEGTGGIYETYHLLWVKFLLNSSEVPFYGALTNSQIENIKASGKIYLNNQLFIVKSIEYKKLRDSNQVTIDAVSVST